MTSIMNTMNRMRIMTLFSDHDCDHETEVDIASSSAAAPKTTKTRIKLMTNSMTKPCTWWT